MLPSVLLTVLCLGIASPAPHVDVGLNALWSQWMATHGKLYDVDEEIGRRAVWEKNMKMIDKHNQEYNLGNHSFTMAMNAFGDLTSEELRQVMNGFQKQKYRKEKVFEEHPLAEIPPSVDWREKGYLTPVKDQGPCGSCWAFSAVGALEGQMFRKTGKLVSLSEQNLMDCSEPQGNGGCSGGVMDYAFQYVLDNRGLDAAESYPYHGADETCKYKPEHCAATARGFWDIYEQESSLIHALGMQGPISVGIDASLISFQFYQKGIYYDPLCSSKDLNHGVLVVGYGFKDAESDDEKYWIVKNRSPAFRHYCAWKPAFSWVPAYLFLGTCRRTWEPTCQASTDANIIVKLCLTCSDWSSREGVCKQQKSHQDTWCSQNEERWRQAVWEKNLKMIDKHNQEHDLGNHSFSMAMNAFGDMGLCGSCWAFSATGALEGQMFQKTSKLVPLSEQNLVDCSRPQGNKGCNGGLMDNAFQYVFDNRGLDSEQSYPYHGMDEPFKYRPEYSAANDTGFYDVPAQEKVLKVTVAKVGPVSVGIDSRWETFQFYKEGIYYDPRCSSKDLGHAVLLVGYGFDGAESDDYKYGLSRTGWTQT
ncbi:Procathepsin L [Manis javanica]|nr:Procathepsin L [Manis javanica]